jgi:16S rRNA (cytosine1402-N4)-methyltransferase
VSSFAAPFHAPVLCNTVVEYLTTRPEGVYLDGTLGGGGHSAALLEALGSNGRVIGVDRDPDAIAYARRRLHRDVEAGRMIVASGRLSESDETVQEIGFESVDGVLFDLGVSSHQLDVPERGFSYSSDGPLDMRMCSGEAVSADEVVNHWTQEEIRRALRSYGEEPRAAVIAAAISRLRPLRSTGELAETVAGVVPARERTKTLSRVFQAIRIVVNDELGELGAALEAATRLVTPGGRIVVISYQSLEDRTVKRYLRSGNTEGRVVRDLYGNRIAPWRPLFGRPLRPSEEEIEENPRSRSARLRAAERTAIPPTGRSS